MKSFSPTEAALEGFRLAKENPRAIGVWAVLQIVWYLVLMGVMITMAGPQIANFTAALEAAGAQSDVAGMEAAFAGLMPVLPMLYLVLIPLGVVVQAVQTGAIMRAVLRPQDGGLGFLRLGGDEFRVGVVVIAKGVIIGLATSVAFVVAALFAALGSIGVLVSILAMLAVIGGAIYLAVRLSLAVPQSFAERRIAIFDSWSLTKGRFGPILGCYLLTFVFFVAILIIGGLAGGAIIAIIALTTQGSATADFSSFAAWLTPIQIVNAIFSGVLNALVLAIAGSPAAVIYASLTGRGQSEVF